MGLIGGLIENQQANSNNLTLSAKCPGGNLVFSQNCRLKGMINGTNTYLSGKKISCTTYSSGPGWCKGCLYVPVCHSCFERVSQPWGDLHGDAQQFI
eukprot:scaffold166716_cov17-Tisochrysis_lutea.AAC.2